MSRLLDTYQGASRRHKCELCGTVFVCDDCSEAMIRALSIATDCALYCPRHERKRDGMPANPWYCNDCEGRY